MVLGFKERFKYPILKGIKIHTIREDKKGRWKPGNKIHGATGVRTDKYHEFFSSNCMSVQKIEFRKRKTNIIIDNHYTMVDTERKPIIDVLVDDRALSEEEVKYLAKNDGFESVTALFEWFDDDFIGVIIHWTAFSYYAKPSRCKHCSIDSIKMVEPYGCYQCERCETNC